MLLLPVEVGRLTGPGLPTELSDACSLLTLLQDEDLSRASENLDAFVRFRNSPTHGNLTENSSFKRSKLQGQSRQSNPERLDSARLRGDSPPLARSGIAAANIIAY